MEDVWVTGRRHVKISKLYLQALLRRGPNIFVALAWSQVFWLVLEAAAGNDNSHGYIRLSSVALYALTLHAGGHFLLFHYHRRALGHHAMDFLVDLVTDVIGFAWIDLAEEMLAQVFRVSARTAFMYSVLAFVASLGAMEVGSSVRGLLEWPPEFEGTANELDAGSFALPTSWLVTQAVHIALYGFFYRTSVAGGQGGTGKRGGEVDVRFAASLFLLVYAMLLSAVAARVIGGTVAASAVVNQHNGSVYRIGGGDVGGDISGWTQGGGIEGVNGSDLLIRTVEAGGPFRASLASDLMTSSPRSSRQRGQELPKRKGDVDALPEQAGATNTSATPSAAERDPRTATVDAKAGLYSGCDDGETGEGTFGDGASQREALPETMATVFSAAAEAVEAGHARRESLRRGLRAYMRITVGMMVGWGYNMWAQVVFRQEELEFRFGPALGATVYATISTALGVCVMVRGADRIDRRGGDDVVPGEDVIDDDDGRLSMGYGEGMRRREEERESRRSALRVFHAKRMLVVAGGVSLMVGWAWEEALDLILETIVGDSAAAGAIAAKLALAVISTAAVLWVELRSRHDGDGHQFSEGDVGGHQGRDHVDTALGDTVEGSGEEYDGEGQVNSSNLLEPLITNTERDGIQ